MRIAYLVEPTYTNISKETKKVTLYKDAPLGTKNNSNTSPTFFNGKHPDIEFDIFYFHPWKTEEERGEQEKYILKNLTAEKYDLFLHSPAWRKISDEFYSAVHQLQVPLVSIFADTLSVTTAEEMRIIKNSDYIVVYDSLTNYLRYRCLLRAMRSQDRVGVSFAAGNQFPADIYKKEVIPQDYDVSLLGSLEGFRMNIAMQLQKELSAKGFNFHFAGGNIDFDNKQSLNAKSDNFLDFNDYLTAINRSKINIVSQTRNERVQIKCKVFEYMACEAFILADKNVEYDLFLPADGIVYYTSIEDCLEKIFYYLAHEDERKRIAKNGCNWFKNNFNYWRFWEETFYAMKSNSLSLPTHPRITEIETELEKKGNINDFIYGEVKEYIHQSLRLKDEIAIKPTYIMVSSAMQKTYLTNPFSGGCWHSGKGLPQWLLFDFTESVKFNTIHIHHLFTNGGIFLKNFSIEGSKDLTNWVSLYQGEMKNVELLQIVHFKNNQDYRYYRLNCFSNYHASQEIKLANVEFYYAPQVQIATAFKAHSRFDFLKFKMRVIFFKLFKRLFKYLPSFLQKRIKSLFSKVYSTYTLEN